MRRDFTYIDDIVEGIYRCCFKAAFSEQNRSDFLVPIEYLILVIKNL